MNNPLLWSLEDLCERGFDHNHIAAECAFKVVCRNDVTRNL